MPEMHMIKGHIGHAGIVLLFKYCETNYEVITERINIKISKVAKKSCLVLSHALVDPNHSEKRIGNVIMTKYTQIPRLWHFYP